MTDGGAAHPRLALPFTVISEGEVVHLIAGEDVRYSVQAGSLAQHLATVLERCDGRCSLDDLLRDVAECERVAMREWIDRLHGERILIEGVAEEVHVAGCYASMAEGRGPLVSRLHRPRAATAPLAILCQDSLDYHTALEFNRRHRRAGGPWLWITTGPIDRAYVSPVFLADVGPCLECLLRQFQRLSPVSQLYDVLKRHGAQSGNFAPAAFPSWGINILEQLALWKVEQMSRHAPARAVFGLHVVELETMEVSVHRVSSDPWCPECANVRLD